MELLGFEQRSRVELPLYLAAVQAGFPSPADDFIDKTLDLNEYLIRHPAATFFVRVAGESMLGAGMHPGDILVVDRAIEPAGNRIVIAAVGGELTVKRIRAERGRLYLAPENPDYPAIEITEDTDFEIWGVVVSVIHKV
jgi:DNA polymerase V